MNAIQFDSELVKTFQGKRVYSWNISDRMQNNFESLHKIWRNENSSVSEETRKFPDGSPECNIFIGGKNMNIGTFEKKVSNKSGKAFFDLSIRMPLYREESFFCVENEQKEKENFPDFTVFLGKNNIGGIWKRESKKGNKYLSGSIFFYGAKDHKLFFSIFKQQDSEVEKVVLNTEAEKEEFEEEPF